MARLSGGRVTVAGGAGEEKEEKSMAVAVAVTVAPTSCHSFSTAFSLATMAPSSSNGGVAPKGLVIRSVQILNGGLQWLRISSSSSGETSGFKGHESRLLLVVRNGVKGHSLVFFFW